MTSATRPPPSQAAIGLALGSSAEERLTSYSRLKLDLAAQVRLLRETMHQRGDEHGVARCAGVMVKLAEDRFTLAVLGQFKRGKSSLMNSVIGRELLPVGVVPLTSAITVLRYGAAERVLIQRQHWKMQQEVPVERLADYVTERGNPGNREQVNAAYVELPLPFLRRGLEFVDTPGVGSSVSANTATTYAFLPQCDAVLFVTSAEAPLNRIEQEFLRDVRQHAAKIFFVVNKIDLVAEAERSEVLDFVRSTLESEAGISGPRLFAISALQGLEAKRRGDEELLLRSGLDKLESALADFLTHQKAEVFFDSVLRRTERLLKGAENEAEIGRQFRLASPEDQRREERILDTSLQKIAAERARIVRRIRERILRDTQAAARERIGSFLVSRHDAMMRQFDRFLGRAGLLSGRTLAIRFSRAAIQQLELAARRELWPILSNQWDSATAIAEGEERDLSANLSAILESAARSDGIGPMEEEPCDLLPRQEHPLTRPPFAAGEWLPALSTPVFRLPAVWCRNRLRLVLAESGRQWLADWLVRAVSAMATAAGEELDRWGAEVRSLAGSMENRVRMAPASAPAVGDALGGIRKALDLIRQEAGRLAEGLPSPDREALEEELPPSEAAGFHGEDRPKDPTQLPADMRVRGCPVCAHLAKVTSDFLSQWQYEIFSSESAQRQFAAELGFCSRHQWQLEAVSSPVGMSVGQSRLARQVARLLQRSAHQPAREGILSKLTARNRPCRVCALEERAEHEYTAEIASLLETDAGRTAYAASQGLCLAHLGRLIAVLRDDAIISFVLACGGRRWAELAEDMESFGMKTEALRRQLRNRDEEDAFWRANILLSGSRSLCVPWPKED